MKRLQAKIVLAAMLCVSTGVHSDDHSDHRSYLCSAEFSSGYDYKKGRWIRERFTPDDRFKIEKSDQLEWSVYDFETEFKYSECGSIVDDVLRCDIDGDFTMNFKTMKFSITSTSSYVDSTRRIRDPVVLTLGSCVKF